MDEKSVVRDHPQMILDVYNSVDWSRVPRGEHTNLAARLEGLAFGKGLFELNLPRRDPNASPSSTGPKQIAPDVPQAILNVSNLVAWYQLNPARIKSLAGKLRSAMQYLNLPKRK
jgi:hypothetical protein